MLSYCSFVLTSWIRGGSYEFTIMTLYLFETHINSLLLPLAAAPLDTLSENMPF